MIWIMIAVAGIVTTIATLFVCEHAEGKRAGNFEAIRAKQVDLIHRAAAINGQHWTDGRTAQEILDDQTQEAFEAAWITPNEDLCAEIDRELGITPEPIAPTYEPRPITHELEEERQHIYDHSGNIVRTLRRPSALRAVHVDPAASLPEVRDGWRRDGEGTWTQVEEPIPHAQAALPRTLGQPEWFVDALKRKSPL